MRSTATDRGHAARDARHPCVLIVEDDPFIAIDLEDAFSDAGFDVLGPFASLAPALKALETRSPDVATLDYELIDTTSGPLAEALARINVPFTLVTSTRPERIREPVFDTCERISKPFDLVNVVAHSRELIAA